MNEKSKLKLYNFLKEHYSESSHATIQGAIEKHLFDRNGIENYQNITHKLYSTLINDLNKKEFDKSAFTNCEYFIKYLYANGELLNDDGFEKEWLIKDILKHFQQSKDRISGKSKSENENKVRNYLNIQELSRIKKFLEIETDNKLTYKQQFSWFLLFEVGLAVSDVLKIRLKESYNDGILKSPTGELIEVPTRFYKHIESHKNSSQDSFKAINIWMRELGESLEFEIPLKPITIKTTRENMLIECSNCQNILIREKDHWVAIEGWIVCKNCAIDLKKKNIISEYDFLEEFELDTNYEMNKRVFITYEELKKQLLEKPIDYLKLHEFQMLIGELGEQYVYEYEMDKLDGSEYVDKIDKTKAKNNLNGYDILSYTLAGKKVHIEVKTTSTLKDEFFITQHELETAEYMMKNGEIYKVYFVKDILGNPQLEILDDVLSEDIYLKKGCSWKKIKQNHMLV